MFATIFIVVTEQTETIVEEFAFCYINIPLYLLLNGLARLNDGTIHMGMPILLSTHFSGWTVIFWPREVKLILFIRVHHRRYVSSVSTCDICDLRMDPKMDLRWPICNSAQLSIAMIMQYIDRQSNKVVSVRGGKRQVSKWVEMSCKPAALSRDFKMGKISSLNVYSYGVVRFN